ncbi:MAG: GNAT family N-acetyltransferase [Ktedonobacteraceae bacterium]|nr:GNAT family N-acetyltransferase [Ktedonobacteraceae bacterium]
MQPKDLEHLPRLPEVIYRPGRREEDAASYVTLLQACQHIDEIDPFSTLEGLPTVEEMAVSFASLDPQRMLVAEADALMIGCVRTIWWEEEDGTWLFLHSGRVLPEWRGQGLGTGFVHWAEQRLRERAGMYPTNGKGTFGANASSTETSATELLLNEGYAVYYTSAQMEFTTFTHLQRPPLPEGFELRTVMPEHYRAIWEAGRCHWAGLTKVSSMPTEEHYQEFLRLVTLDPALLLVIWHDRQPVAIVQGHMAQETGIVDDVVVSPAYKRRGLAQAAMTEALMTMRERGAKRIRLHTDASNRHGARSLYEKMGFRAVKLFPRYRKPMGM